MLDRKFPRRDFIKYASAASALALSGGRMALAAAVVPPHPDPKNFQSGDFLWPAKPGDFIPRYSVRGLARDEEAATWEEERRKFVDDARVSGDPAQIDAANQMEQLTYAEFQARYFDGAGEGAGGGDGGNLRSLAPRAFGIPQVGHVAMLEVDAAGVPWVIEAMPKSLHRYESLYSRFPNGVIRGTYTDWIKQHEVYNVWHGRLRSFDAGQRASIVTHAKPYLGKDYWFWSFNLNDESAFYCSKLVWVSVWKAINLALDGDTSFSRSFWVTPKQLVYATSIELLHNPGAYGGQ
jgi:hypothetical protein